MTDYTGLIASLHKLHAEEHRPTFRTALRDAAAALEAAEKVIRDVDKWVDELYPYIGLGTEPAPVFQACREWLDKHGTRT